MICNKYVLFICGVALLFQCVTGYEMLPTLWTTNAEYKVYVSKFMFHVSQHHWIMNNFTIPLTSCEKQEFSAILFFVVLLVRFLLFLSYFTVNLSVY